jgi:hypothetical protein
MLTRFGPLGTLLTSSFFRSAWQSRSGPLSARLCSIRTDADPPFKRLPNARFVSPAWQRGSPGSTRGWSRRLARVRWGRRPCGNLGLGYVNLPLAFEPNVGQTDARCAFWRCLHSLRGQGPAPTTPVDPGTIEVDATVMLRVEIGE